MTRPKPPTCSRCKGPRGYSNRGKGLCQTCIGVCPVCEERPRVRGFKRTSPYCNPCACALIQANLCTPEGKERLRKRRQARHRAGPALEMIRAAKARARRRGLPFNLTPQDLEVPERCPVLGMPLVVGTRRQKEHAPSLDRLDPAKGYVKGNVRVISFRANTLKRDASVNELEAVIRYMKGL